MGNGEITVREATRDDIAAIVTFQQNMARETENKSLDAALVTKGVEALFDSGGSKGFYIVAEGDGRPVGSMLITYEWSDWRNATFWWIQSVYVDASWRRKGVYRSMYAHIYGIANSRKDICGIRLYVERTNQIAQTTYSNLGMSKSHYDLYEIDL
jgi:ribosomal protein S18 acetylase RimI-like enzyme